MSLAMRRNLASSNWSRQVPWFAFVVHLRKREELDDWSASGFMRSHWGSEAGWQDQVLTAPPFVISTLSFRASPATGELILIPRLPEDVVFGEGRRLVARAVEIAVERGARVVGLGGLTAPATRGGAALIPALPEGVTLTTGNAFTAAVARHNARDACRHLGRPRPVVAVLGATGSVGIAASRLLAEDEIELLLVGRSVPRLQRAVPELQGRAVFSSELGDLRRADVVLVLTSDRSAKLSAQHFDDSRRRVVVDLAQPANVEPHTVAQLSELRVSAVRGGWVHIPGATSSHDAQRVIAAEDPSAPPGSGPACLAETCMFAVEGIREHATGAASVVLAQRLERIAAKRAVRVLPLALDQVQAPAAVASTRGSGGDMASQGNRRSGQAR